MAKRKNDGMMTIAEYEKLTGKKYEPAERMTLEEYKALYKLVLKLSFDAECFGLFEMIIDRDIEKAKYIRAIMEHIMDYKNVEYDYFEILESSYED